MRLLLASLGLAALLAFVYDVHAQRFDVEEANLALLYSGQPLWANWSHPGDTFTSYELQLKSYERDFVEWTVVLPESATSHEFTIPRTGHYYLALRTVFETPMGDVFSPWVHSHLNGKGVVDLNGTTHLGPFWLHGALAPPGPIGN